MNLIFELNIYKSMDLCQHYIQYADLKLVDKKNNYCKFKCKLDNICRKANSILLTSRTGEFIELEKHEKLLVLEQVYKNKDSALVEFNFYYSGIIKEFDSYCNIFRYTVNNEIEFDTTKNYNKLPIRSAFPDILIRRQILVKSFNCRATIFIGLKMEHKKYIIFTNILD